MAVSDEHIDAREFQAMLSADTPPLMAKVPEPPPSHWGKLTSQSRTLSPQYMAFLQKHKEVRDGQ
jgi:hypothetical protein